LSLGSSLATIMTFPPFYLIKFSFIMTSPPKMILTGIAGLLTDLTSTMCESCNRATSFKAAAKISFASLTPSTATLSISLASFAYLVAIISSAATIDYCSSATFLSAVMTTIISSVSFDATSSNGAFAVSSTSIFATSSFAKFNLSKPLLRR